MKHHWKRLDFIDLSSQKEHALHFTFSKVEVELCLSRDGFAKVM